MPVHGNRSHASSQLQATTCSFLHPKKSTEIMDMPMESASEIQNGIEQSLLRFCPVLAGAYLYVDQLNRVGSCLSRPTVTDPKRMQYKEGGVNFQVVQMYEHEVKEGRRHVSQPGRRGVGKSRRVRELRTK
jgi:hypothetical protein